MRRVFLWGLCSACLFLPTRLRGADRWELQYFHDKNESSLSFSDLQFPSAARGVAVGILEEARRRKPVAAVTSDGGRSWQLLPLKQPAFSLFFLNEQAGWMVDQKGTLWKTSDVGRTWMATRPAGVRATPLRVFFLDQSRGWLLCAQKQVYGTSDGGQSWQLLAASREPDLPETRTVYTWAAFADGKTGLLTGWSRPLGFRSRLPAWMEPELIPLGVKSTTGILLHSTDGGAGWKPHVRPGLGEIARVRMGSGGRALLLLRHPDSLATPTEVHSLDLTTLRTQALYANRNLWIADLAFAGPDRVLAAALDQQGRTPHPAIPARLKVLQSVDGSRWTEMDVDYRAEARLAVLAVPDAAHAWLATDTGMILRWVKE